MRTWAVGIAIALLAGPLTGQTPLTLDEALSLVQQNNLRLRKQEHNQRIAELEVVARRGQLLPSVDLFATSFYTDEVAKFDLPTFVTSGRQVRIELGGHDRSDVVLGLRQPIFTGFRLRTQVDLARNALESERLQDDLLRRQIAFQVARLYYQAQSLKKEYRIHQARLRRLRAQLDQVRSLLEAAQVTAFDTLQVANQGLQVRLDLDRNRRDQRLIDLEMARLLDLPSPRPIAEMDLPAPDRIEMAVDSLKQVARKQRPELAAVTLAKNGAKLNRKLLQAAYYPQVSAEVRYHVAKPGLNQVTNEWMDYGSVGIRFQWNLWRGQQDRHRIQEAEVEYQRLLLEERDLLRGIEHEVERSWENLRFAYEQFELAERLRQQEEERYRIVSAQQQSGVATTNDVIVAEADLTAAELQVERTVIQFYLSRSELLLATGAMPR